MNKLVKFLVKSDSPLPVLIDLTEDPPQYLALKHPQYTLVGILSHR